MLREGTFRQVWPKCDNMGHFQNYIQCLHVRVPRGTLSLAVLPGPQGCVFAHGCLEKEISECSLLTSHTSVSLQASACSPQLILMLLSFRIPGRSKEQGPNSKAATSARGHSVQGSSCVYDFVRVTTTKLHRQERPTQALHLSPPLKMLNAKNELMQASKTGCSKSGLKE